MSDKPERFLSPSNVHRTLWSILLAVLAFGAGLVWKHFTGKDKIVVASTEDGAKPLVVRVERTSDDPALQTNDRIGALADEVRRLREQIPTTLKASPGHRLPSKALPIQDGSFALNALQIPAFHMPVAVKGYTEDSLAGFGRANCPQKELVRGDSLVFRLSTYPVVNIDELTPLFLAIIRRTSPNNTLVLLERQFVLRSGVNQIEIQFDYPPGNYDLRLGFYVRAELKTEYPNLYGMKCELTVR
jgi:hypothetical protein